MGMKYKQIRLPDVGSIVYRWVMVDREGKEIGDNTPSSIRKKIVRTRPYEGRPIEVKGV